MLQTGGIPLGYLAVMWMKQHFSEITGSLSSNWKSRHNRGAIRKDTENEIEDVFYLLPKSLMCLSSGLL